MADDKKIYFSMVGAEQDLSASKTGFKEYISVLFLWAKIESSD